MARNFRWIPASAVFALAIMIFASCQEPAAPVDSFSDEDASFTPVAGLSVTNATRGTGDAWTLAEDMGIAANIGNTLENTYSWETGWGQPEITKAYIDGMAANGIKSVRVPVAWDTYAANGTINAPHLARVRQVVGWILDAGMYAMVNIHWDGGWINGFNSTDESHTYVLTQSIKDKFGSYWTQIADGLADFDDRLIFEGLNEEGVFYLDNDNNGVAVESDGIDYAALNALNQLFVTTVRSRGTGTTNWNDTRCLLIAGFGTDIDKTCVASFAIPSDPSGAGKLLLSVHYYTPSLWCIANGPVNWGGIKQPRTTWGTASDITELDGFFDKLENFASARDVPVMIGEFGVGVGDTGYEKDPGDRAKWMHAVMQTARDRGMVPMLWDTGSDIGRNAGSFSPAFQAAVDALVVN